MTSEIIETKNGYLVKIGNMYLPGYYETPLLAERARQKSLGKREEKRLSKEK